MRFVHISDLHIGKKLKERSLEEDQRHILGQILSIIDDVSPDAVLIAGDVYDTSSPTIESVRMLDWFLTELSTRDLDTFMIAGNHDSADKLGFGSRIFEKNRLFISGVFSGTMDRHRVVRGEEVVDVYLLPFIKPINVRRFHPDEDVESYEDAV
ncbi:MAG: exonuclease subunit SbcD, partial [Candidatus Methanomethylophilaceae archaeon]|nr:exonuclease subunit SbcD [Candidatus Methanomethylophilaceae archaeon]